MFQPANHFFQSAHPVLSKARLYPAFLQDGRDFACMLVLPGGGYSHVSHQEGPPVAAWLNSIGISALVLEYSVSSDPAEAIYPQPQQQALYALRFLRAQATALNIDPHRIGVIGFSAGGHLAASCTQAFDHPDFLLDSDASLKGVSARPDASILCYPVISAGLHGHVGSFECLLGRGSTPSQRSALSWEHRIHPNSPPSFLWHTAEDAAVPVENSYLYAMALQQARIPHALHVFSQGAHGLGLCSLADRRQQQAMQWRALAERWLLDLGF